MIIYILNIYSLIRKGFLLAGFIGFYSLPFILVFFDIDLNGLLDFSCSDRLKFFLENSLFLEFFYGKIEFFPRTFLNSFLIYFYTVVTLIGIYGKMGSSYINEKLKLILIMLKGFIFGIIIKISWAYYIGSVVLLNLFNQVLIEKKLSLEDKINLFNAIKSEFSSQLRVTYEDVASGLDHINDPLTVRLYVENYFLKVSNLMAQTNNAVAPIVDNSSLYWVFAITVTLVCIVAVATTIYMSNNYVSIGEFNKLNKSMSDELSNINNLGVNNTDLHNNTKELIETDREGLEILKKHVDQLSDDVEKLPANIKVSVDQALKSHHDTTAVLIKKHHAILERLDERLQAVEATTQTLEPRIKEALETTLTAERADILKTTGKLVDMAVDTSTQFTTGYIKNHAKEISRMALKEYLKEKGITLDE